MALDGKLLAVVQAIAADIKALLNRQVSVVFVIDGGGAAVGAGSQVDLELPGNLQPLSWSIVADVAGNAVVDILKGSYANYPTMASVTGTDQPVLAAVQKNKGTALTGWDTAWLAGDMLRANVVSAATVKRLTVTVRCKRA